MPLIMLAPYTLSIASILNLTTNDAFIGINFSVSSVRYFLHLEGLSESRTTKVLTESFTDKTFEPIENNQHFVPLVSEFSKSSIEDTAQHGSITTLLTREYSSSDMSGLFINHV